MININKFSCTLSASVFSICAVFQAFFYCGALVGSEDSVSPDCQFTDQATLPTIGSINSALSSVIARSRSDQDAYNQLGSLAALLSERYVLRTFIAVSADAGIPENISNVRRQLNRMQLFNDQLDDEMVAILDDIDRYCQAECEMSFSVIEEICNAFILATDSFYDALNRFETGLGEVLSSIQERLGDGCDAALFNSFSKQVFPDEDDRLDMVNLNDFTLLKRRVYRFEENVLQWVKKISRRLGSRTKKELLSVVRKQIKQLRENLEGALNNIVALLKNSRSSLRYVHKLSFRMPRFASAMHTLSSDLHAALFEGVNPSQVPYALEVLPEQYRQASSEAQAQCIAYLKDYAVYYYHALELMDILMYLDPKMLNDRSSGQMLNAENWKFDGALRQLIQENWLRFTAFIREKFIDELNEISELRARHTVECSDLIDQHIHMFGKLFQPKFAELCNQGLHEETLHKLLLYRVISTGKSILFPLWPAQIFNYVMELLERLSGQKLTIQRSCSWDSYVKSLIREFREQVENLPCTRRPFKKIGFNNFVNLEWLGESSGHDHGLPGGGPSLSQPVAAQQKKPCSKKPKKKKTGRRRKQTKKTKLVQPNKKAQASEDQFKASTGVLAPTVDAQDSAWDDKSNQSAGAVPVASERPAKPRRIVLEGCFEPNFRILGRSDHMVVARYWRGLKMGENILLILYRLEDLPQLDYEACRIKLDPAILPRKDDQPEHKWDIYHAFPEEVETFLPSLGVLLEPSDALWRELGLSEQRVASNLFGSGYALAIGAKLIRGFPEHPTLKRAQELIDTRISHRGCFVWHVRNDADRTVYHRMFHRIRGCI